MDALARRVKNVSRRKTSDPAIILADETAGKLDTKNRDEIVRLLANQEIDRRTAVATLSHDRYAASRIERMLFLNDGKITEQMQRIHLAEKLHGRREQNEQETVETQEEL